MGFGQISQYVFLGVGIYCIIRGIITIVTGNVSKSEEAQIKEYSDKGAKRFKILSAVSNIVGGLLCIIISIIRIMKILDEEIFIFVVLGVLVLLVVVYFVIKKSCKEAK
ncbi:MAG: hypothetical protein IKG14_03500 [Clostridia bacterium]|nr:hypothetical protein [Clostridia bacterium]